LYNAFASASGLPLGGAFWNLYHNGRGWVIVGHDNSRQIAQIRTLHDAFLNKVAGASDLIADAGLTIYYAKDKSSLVPLSDLKYDSFLAQFRSGVAVDPIAAVIKPDFRFLAIPASTADLDELVKTMYSRTQIFLTRSDYRHRGQEVAYEKPQGPYHSVM
jgi:hypothetical protein